MNRKSQGLVGGLVGVFIFAIVATALIPTVADQTALAINGGTTNLSSTDQTLLALWPTFIVIGGLIAIIAAVGLS
jgi:hypothetical protein